MTSPSSIFRPKLQDEEYMELVFEDGQIIAKGQRSNVSYQRTKSIMDLYEAEYEKDFSKTTHDRLYLFLDFTYSSTDEQSMVEMDFTYSSTQDSVGSTYKSSSLDDDVRPRVVAKTRKASVKSRQVCNSLEREERQNIEKQMRALQDLLPNSHKDDDESVLDEAINYVTSLQHQVQVQQANYWNCYVTPSMILPMAPHYSQMGVPQFLNHPGFMSNPMECHFPHFVPYQIPRNQET